MIDHVFLTVSNLDRSIDFYTKALVPLGIVERFDYASPSLKSPVI